MDSCSLKRNVSALHDERAIALTSSLRRLDIGKGNAFGRDGVPVDVALDRRDVDTLGLSPLREVLSRLDGGAEGDGGEEECGCESSETEQHCCCVRPPSISSRFIPGQSIGSIYTASTPPTAHLVDTCEFDGGWNT